MTVILRGLRRNLAVRRILKTARNCCVCLVFLRSCPACPVVVLVWFFSQLFCVRLRLVLFSGSVDAYVLILGRKIGGFELVRRLRVLRTLTRSSVLR